MSDTVEPTGYYRTLGPNDLVQPGDEIAWPLNDLSRPESWNVVMGSVGVCPKDFPRFVWRRLMAYEQHAKDSNE